MFHEQHQQTILNPNPTIGYNINFGTLHKTRLFVLLVREKTLDTVSPLLEEPFFLAFEKGERE